MPPHRQYAALCVTLAAVLATGLGVVYYTAPKPAAVQPKTIQPTTSTTVEEFNAAAEKQRAHRMAYVVAREKAAKEVAAKKGISRKAAAELVATVNEQTLREAVAAAGISLEGMPAAGLDAILQWIVDHQDLIIDIVKIILAILAVV